MKHTLVAIIGEGGGEDAMRPLVVIRGVATKKRVMPYLVDYFSGCTIDLDVLWDEGYSYTGCETVLLSMKEVVYED